MKIVRLSTENVNAIFDNNFNTDIILKPFSKVALQNLSLETAKESLIISPENDEYEFAIGTNNTKTGKLINQTYTHNNSSLLLADLQDDLNNRIGDKTQEIGLEWKVATNKANKVVVEYKRGLDQEHFAKLTTNNGVNAVDVSGTAPNHIFTPSTLVATGTNNCYMTLNDYYISLGAGRTSLKINNLKPENGSGFSSQQGFIFGLSSVNPATITQGDTYPSLDIEYGVRCYATDLDYAVIEQGIVKPANTPFTPEIVAEGDVNNDSIEILRDNGVWRIIVYSNTNGTRELDFLESVVNVEYYPIIIFRGISTDVSIREFRTTLSPYQVKPTTETKNALLGISPPAQDTLPQEHYFDFGSISTANFLGFDNQRNPQTGYSRATANYTLTANREYEPIDVADSFIVEMMGNITLSSYDGLKSVKKSILAVIPETDNNANGSVIFDAKEKVFVDMNNVNPLTLRNVKVRVVKNDYTSLKMKGEATMTLIFKDENE